MGLSGSSLSWLTSFFLESTVWELKSKWKGNAGGSLEFTTFSLLCVCVWLDKLTIRNWEYPQSVCTVFIAFIKSVFQPFLTYVLLSPPLPHYLP